MSFKQVYESILKDQTFAGIQSFLMVLAVINGSRLVRITNKFLRWCISKKFTIERVLTLVVFVIGYHSHQLEQVRRYWDIEYQYS